MNDLDLASRLDVVVDQQAEPVDLDRALARFLLAFVRSTPGPVPPAEIVISQPGIE